MAKDVGIVKDSRSSVGLMAWGRGKSETTGRLFYYLNLKMFVRSSVREREMGSGDSRSSEAWVIHKHQILLPTINQRETS